MKATAARFWYKHVLWLAALLDGLNTDGDATYALGNEGIRRIAREMSAYTEDITDTQKIVPVKVVAVGELDCGSD